MYKEYQMTNYSMLIRNIQDYMTLFCLRDVYVITVVLTLLTLILELKVVDLCHQYRHIRAV